MGKLGLYFWALFILYFIFAHPIIVGGFTNDFNTPASLAEKDGVMALVYLGISVLMWAAVFGYTLYLLYLSSFKAAKNINYILEYGKLIPANIIESKKSKHLVKKMMQKNIVIEFNNLSRETVWHKMDVLDSKPDEKRFEGGKKIYLRVDETLTKPPYLVIEGWQTKINFIPFLIWLFFVLFVVGEYLYFYTKQNQGFGWRFMNIGHPLILSAGMAMLFGGIGFGIFRFIFKNTSRDKKFMLLKLKGVKTMARVVSVAQTGTYINEQPQVKFELEFTDRYGRQREVSFKKIVSLLAMGNIQQPQQEIFYLPDDPETVGFAEDINKV